MLVCCGPRRLPRLPTDEIDKPGRLASGAGPAAPTVGGDDGAVMATEADEHHAVAGVALAHELTQVDHAGGNDVGGAGVATLYPPRRPAHALAAGRRNMTDPGT